MAFGLRHETKTAQPEKLLARSDDEKEVDNVVVLMEAVLEAGSGLTPMTACDGQSHSRRGGWTMGKQSCIQRVL